MTSVYQKAYNEMLLEKDDVSRIPAPNNNQECNYVYTYSFSSRWF